MQYDDFLDENHLHQYAAAINQRARAMGAKGRITVEELRTRILESGGKCEWCGASLVGADFHIDHLLSLSQHGQNTPDNLVIACPSCNRRKAEKHPSTFALEMVAETGRKTPLIQRILDHYQIDAPVQRSLFDEDAPSERDQGGYNWSNNP
jgi:5-methylcytosine-specific restriction endonuclease McrA